MECAIGPPEKRKCIIDYELKQRSHIFTLANYVTGDISKLELSNLLFDNGVILSDISDTSIKQKDNSCWSLEFGIHSKCDIMNIVKWKTVTFMDGRLWVSSNKMIGNTKWKHPYTEMANGVFNARSGHCSNTMDLTRRFIVVGRNLIPTGIYDIQKINKNGFMQIRTDNGLVTQHLNNFDEVNPEDVIGVWFNDNLNLWVFEDTDEVNAITESYVYLLLDTHSRRSRYCAKDETKSLYTYDYTKAKAFFSETEAINYAKRINKRMRTTFTVDQWI